MGFIDDLTPAKYKLQSLRIEKEGEDIVAHFVLSLFSESGESIRVANYSVTMGEGERSTLVSFVRDKLEAMENETGLVKV
jgi:hypothetical protein